MIIVPVVITISGLLIFLISLPLIRRKVPMNSLYGIRIPAAFESEERWYAVNEYGGRKLRAWSSLVIADGVAGFFIPSPRLPTFALWSVVLILFSISVTLCRVLVWSRKQRRIAVRQK